MTENLHLTKVIKFFNFIKFKSENGRLIFLITGDPLQKTIWPFLIKTSAYSYGKK